MNEAQFLSGHRRSSRRPSAASQGSGLACALGRTAARPSETPTQLEHPARGIF